MTSSYNLIITGLKMLKINVEFYFYQRKNKNLIDINADIKGLVIYCEKCSLKSTCNYV